MKLYSIKNYYPNELPWRIRLPDGSTRTDPSTFTPEIIAEAGYVEVESPPSYDPETEQLNWDGFSWSVIPIV